jgi:hypothetical protein
MLKEEVYTIFYLQTVSELFNLFLFNQTVHFGDE